MDRGDQHGKHEAFFQRSDSLFHADMVTHGARMHLVTTCIRWNMCVLSKIMWYGHRTLLFQRDREQRETLLIGKEYAVEARLEECSIT